MECPLAHKSFIFQFFWVAPEAPRAVLESEEPLGPERTTNPLLPEPELDLVVMVGLVGLAWVLEREVQLCNCNMLSCTYVLHLSVSPS